MSVWACVSGMRECVVYTLIQWIKQMFVQILNEVFGRIYWFGMDWQVVYLTLALTNCQI